MSSSIQSRQKGLIRRIQWPLLTSSDLFWAMLTSLSQCARLGFIIASEEKAVAEKQNSVVEVIDAMFSWIWLIKQMSSVTDFNWFLFKFLISTIFHWSHFYLFMCTISLCCDKSPRHLNSILHKTHFFCFALTWTVKASSVSNCRLGCVFWEDVSEFHSGLGFADFTFLEYVSSEMSHQTVLSC